MPSTCGRLALRETLRRWFFGWTTERASFSVMDISDPWALRLREAFGRRLRPPAEQTALERVGGGGEHQHEDHQEEDDRHGAGDIVIGRIVVEAEAEPLGR